MGQLLTSVFGGEKDKNGTGERNRPLQGLAPYTVNAGLAYQGSIFGAASITDAMVVNYCSPDCTRSTTSYEASRDVNSTCKSPHAC